MIRFITFDLGNVLCRVDHTEAWRRTREYTSLNDEVLFQRFYQNGDAIEHMMGQISDDEFFERLAEKLEFKAGAESLQKYWEAVFTPIPERLGLLKELGTQFVLGAISNISPLHSNFLENHVPEMQHLRHRTYSWQCGYLKPRSEIFSAALTSSGFEASACLFIDDQAQHVEAARNHGLQAIQIDLEEDLRAPLGDMLDVDFLTD